MNPGLIIGGLIMGVIVVGGAYAQPNPSPLTQEQAVRQAIVCTNLPNDYNIVLNGILENLRAHPETPGSYVIERGVSITPELGSCGRMEPVAGAIIPLDTTPAAEMILEYRRVDGRGNSLGTGSMRVLVADLGVTAGKRRIVISWTDLGTDTRTAER